MFVFVQTKTYRLLLNVNGIRTKLRKKPHFVDVLMQYFKIKVIYHSRFIFEI